MSANEIQGQRAEQAFERLLDEFALLSETANDLALQHDIGALLQAIVERAKRLLGPADAAVLLYDANRADLTLAAVTGARAPLGTRLGLGVGVNGRVAQTRQPMIVNDYDKSEFYVERFKALNIGAVLSVPMLLGGELVGVLALSSTLDQGRHFSDGDARLLSLFAIQAAGAVRSAQLLQESRERADLLAASEARVRRLVDANIVGIVIADIRGNVREANDAYLKIIGYSRDDLAAGRINWRDLTPPEYEAVMHEAQDEARRSGSSTYEKEYLRKDGSRVPVLVGAAVFEGGEEAVAFVLDLSEHRRADAEHRARIAAEAASKAKSVFLANMSHELRTPLNAILGFAQILQFDKSIGERAALGLTTIRSAGEHLLMLINDILDLSRIEAGKLELRFERIDLPALLKDIAETMRIKAEQKELRFSLDLAPGVPTAVQADEMRLRQVLLNLLSNAVKFTDRGGISLSIQPIGDKLRFEVRDSGIGIAAGHLQTIFEPFEQVAEAPRRLGGTGLGLAISRRLVRGMGGELEVASEVGQGSRFWFDVALPVAESAPPATGVQHRPTGYAGRRRRVLVVDDTADNRTMLAELLDGLKFELELAHAGEAALAKASAAPLALILLDIVMPGVDGLEVTRRLRAMPSIAGVPIVLVSASSSGFEPSQCEQLGANAFLAKPIDVDRLLATIGELLRLDWLHAAPPSPALPTAE